MKAQVCITDSIVQMYDKEYFREWQRINKQKVLKRNKKWRVANKEKVKDITKKNKAKNNARFKEYNSTWQKNNKDKIASYNQKRRFKLKSSKENFTAKEWEVLKVEYNFKCASCGVSEEILIKETKMGLTIDHIIPLSKDGDNSIKNIQPLCKSCNSKKGNQYQS